MRSMNKTRLGVAVAALAVVLIGAGAAAAQDVLLEGNWTKKNYAIQGSWRIVEENGIRAVVLDGDFATKRAPDLKIFLSPRSLEELGDGNATAGSLRIAQLKRHKGSQRYEISKDVDLGSYKTILIHCEKYSKLWGAADLTRDR